MKQTDELTSRMSIVLRVNGRDEHLEVSPRETLADALRERLDLTGTHLGCEHGVCGACTVIVDGLPARACIMYAVQADGRDVRTVEGVQGEPQVQALQEAFSRNHALQCGFCTPGFLMLARWGLGEEGAARCATPEAVAASNLCRCGCYQGIRQAMREVWEPGDSGAQPAGER